MIYGIYEHYAKLAASHNLFLVASFLPVVQGTVMLQGHDVPRNAHELTIT